MKDNKVLIEKWKGVDIFYDKETNRFVAEHKKANTKVESSTLFDVRCRINDIIDEVYNELVDEKYIIKDYSTKLMKITVHTRNKVNKRISYTVTDCTDLPYYDINKEKNTDSDTRLFDLSKENLEVYDKIRKLEKNISGLELEQKKFMEMLK